MACGFREGSGAAVAAGRWGIDRLRVYTSLNTAHLRRAGTPVLEARQLMQERRIRHLLVIEDDRLLGIVTDRDIRLNLPSPATSLSVWEVNYLIARLTVGQVMTKSVIVVDPESPARAAAYLLLSEKIGALPVVDAGRVIGIVTESDFVRAFANSETHAAMTPAER